MNNNKLVSALLAMLLFLAACRTGKVYTQPQTVLPATYRSEHPIIFASADSAGIGAVRWQDFFTDTTLRGLIDSVLRNNYDRSVALDNIKLSSEYVKQAKAGYLPTLSLGATAATNRFSENSLNGRNGFDLKNFVGVGSIEDYTLQAAAAWEIDIWGKVRGRKQEALATYLQTEEAAAALQTRLIAATASGYYNLVMLRQQLEIAQYNLALSDSTVQMVGLQAATGEVTELALWQAEVQQKEVALLVPTLEQAITIQENALSLLMARAPGRISMPSGTTFPAMPETWHAGVPLALLRNRPDIREAEYAVKAAHARMGVTKAELYPTFSITAAGGLNSFRASDWIMLPASLFGNIAGNALQPVLNRRQLKTAVKVSGIQYGQSVTTFKSRVLAAVTEVSDALTETEKVGQRIHVAASQQAILDKAIPGSRLLFDNGEANYLEVITAQQKALDNKLRLADLHRQQATALLQLYRAAGGGSR